MATCTNVLSFVGSVPDIPTKNHNKPKKELHWGGGSEYPPVRLQFYLTSDLDLT